MNSEDIQIKLNDFKMVKEDKITFDIINLDIKNTKYETYISQILFNKPCFVIFKYETYINIACKYTNKYDYINVIIKILNYIINTDNQIIGFIVDETITQHLSILQEYYLNNYIYLYTYYNNFIIYDKNSETPYSSITFAKTNFFNDIIEQKNQYINESYNNNTNKIINLKDQSIDKFLFNQMLKFRYYKSNLPTTIYTNISEFNTTSEIFNCDMYNVMSLYKILSAKLTSMENTITIYRKNNIKNHNIIDLENNNKINIINDNIYNLELKIENLTKNNIDLEAKIINLIDENSKLTKMINDIIEQNESNNLSLKIDKLIRNNKCNLIALIICLNIYFIFFISFIFIYIPIF